MTCELSLSGCLGPFSYGPLFFPKGGGGGGGYRDWEKFVWMRPPMCYARFGESKKNCLHSRSGGKNFQVPIDGGKKFPAS